MRYKKNLWLVLRLRWKRPILRALSRRRINERLNPIPTIDGFLSLTIASARCKHSIYTAQWKQPSPEHEQKEISLFQRSFVRHFSFSPIATTIRNGSFNIKCQLICSLMICSRCLLACCSTHTTVNRIMRESEEWREIVCGQQRRHSNSGDLVAIQAKHHIALILWNADHECGWSGRMRANLSGIRTAYKYDEPQL